MTALQSNLHEQSNTASTVIARTRSPLNVGKELGGYDGFFPVEPTSLKEAGLTIAEMEGFCLRYLLTCGTGSGRAIADNLRMPFNLIAEVLQMLKDQLLLTFRDSAPMNDYVYELSEQGLIRARRRAEHLTYFGAAPVRFSEYVDAVKRQSVDKVKPNPADLRRAFADLQLSDAAVSQIGQAVTGGRSMFLYGAPGNGKTSIAERVIRSVSEHIWIPRAITVTDEIIRVFDPACHEELPFEANTGMLQTQKVDRRWVRIKRPTVVAGGELTLEMLECHVNPTTGVNEAPLQMKSNCGALVIDDFGRQRISTTELLNRWIIPLEKGHDYIMLPSGRHIQIPFAQLLVFSTNLDPRQIVDEAFLRRIPYKIEVTDPSEPEFRQLFCRLADKMGFVYQPKLVDYVLDKHYRRNGRPLRFCHAGDILVQVKNLCDFHNLPYDLSENAIDVAAFNYFAGL
jgi:predicted ATPase with chaperone activity